MSVQQPPQPRTPPTQASLRKATNVETCSTHHMLPCSWEPANYMKTQEMKEAIKPAQVGQA